MARALAVMRSAHVALRFEERPSGITFRMFVDGNRNGVRTTDIAAGIDAPTRRADTVSAISIRERRSPSAKRRALTPCALVSSNLLSCTPLGTCTSGSVFVRGRDGSQFAIRVLGCHRPRPRAAIRTLDADTWVDGFESARGTLIPRRWKRVSWDDSYPGQSVARPPGCDISRRNTARTTALTGFQWHLTLVTGPP